MIDCIHEMVEYDETIRKDSKELLKRYDDGNIEVLKWEQKM